MGGSEKTKTKIVVAAVKGSVGGLLVCALSLLVFGLIALAVESPIGVFVESLADRWIILPFQYWWPAIATFVGVGVGAWLVLKVIPSSDRRFMFGAFSLLPIIGVLGLIVSFADGAALKDLSIPIINGASSLFAGYYFLLHSDSKT